MDASTPNRAGIKPALYAQPDITARGRFSKSHLYNLMARGLFPAPVLKQGPRFTRWSSAEVDEWFADPAGWIERSAAGQGLAA